MDINEVIRKAFDEAVEERVNVLGRLQAGGATNEMQKLLDSKSAELAAAKQELVNTKTELQGVRDALKKHCDSERDAIRGRDNAEKENRSLLEKVRDQEADIESLRRMLNRNDWETGQLSASCGNVYGKLADLVHALSEAGLWDVAAKPSDNVERLKPIIDELAEVTTETNDVASWIRKCLNGDRDVDAYENLVDKLKDWVDDMPSLDPGEY